MTLRVTVFSLIAALAMLGASPTLHSGVRDLKMMSRQELTQLPNGTKVTVGRRTTTLGMLRANHNALLASRRRAKIFNPANPRSLGPVNLSFNKNFGPVRPGHLIPVSIATPAPPPRASFAKFAADYQQFCNSVSASVCLYYPAGVYWTGRDSWGDYQTEDDLSSDADCTQGNGNVTGEYGSYVSCVYTYPSLQFVGFTPPGSGFKTTGWCDRAQGYFTLQLDPHGYVKAQDAGASGFNTSVGEPGGNTSQEKFCFIQVLFGQ